MVARAAMYGLARILSKRGLCSRSQAERLIRAGRVKVGGRVCLDPERPTALDAGDIVVDAQAVGAAPPLYVMLNKPRGLVTTRHDERGRGTVYDCLADAGLPWLAPVGRLDQASEGLLLLSNDSAWAAGSSTPGGGLRKRYHVHIDRVFDDLLLQRLRAGIDDQGEHLRALGIEPLRHGSRSSWLEFVLDEGRNRQIRRMLAACDTGVQRLVRVAIGPLSLGDLGKGAWRHLDAAEVQSLRIRNAARGAGPAGDAAA